jgi:hypothetical protein
MDLHWKQKWYYTKPKNSFVSSTKPKNGFVGSTKPKKGFEFVAKCETFFFQCTLKTKKELYENFEVS